MGMYNDLYSTSKNPKLAGEITSPVQFAKVSAKTMTVTGWAIADSGVKEVQIFVDGQIKGKVVPNIATPDINEKYPGHVNGSNSGYKIDVDVSNISSGYKVVIARTVANDGSIKDAGRTVYFNKLESKGEIITPEQFANVSAKSMTVTGWAIADSGVKEVQIFVDGKLKSTVVPNKATADIGKTYSNYPNASTSGYEATVDTSDVSQGYKVIIARAVANDGSIRDAGRTVLVNKLESKGEIITPEQFANVSAKSMTVTGWAIADSGVKEVQIFVDGKLKSTVVPNKATADIGKTYSNYPNASTSGYEATVDTSDVSQGYKVIIARTVANDGSIRDAGRTVLVNKLESKGEIITPEQFANVSAKSMTVTGWAIADSGVKEVQIFVDGKLKSTVVPNKATADIGKTYSNYPNASTSGYEATVDTSDVSQGYKVIIARTVANDGSIRDAGRTVLISKLETKGEIQSPAQFDKVSGNTMKVTGWTVAGSGVKEVSIIVDGKVKGTVVPNKTTTDIGKTYSNYPNANTSGYEVTVDISDITEGNKVIIARTVGNDGTIKDAGRTVFIDKLQTKGEINTPEQFEVVHNNQLTISGWTIAKSGVKEVDIFVDGKYKGKVVPNKSTLDIQSEFSYYPNAATSGYEITVDISDVTEGNKVIIARTVGNDGSIRDAGRTFEKKTKNLVVIDPGHNYGGDYGATSTFNGVFYSETDLNMQVSLKLESALKAQGYSVILTRSSLERSTLDQTTSLRTRAILANSYNADLFISIHHNSVYPNTTARGSEVYYTERTAGDNGMPAHNPDKFEKSRDLAIATASSISNNTGFINRGGKGDVSSLGIGLSVLRNTKMPAILVECGYISNPTEASLLATDSNQQATANGITQAVKARY
nr:N-acetylmuramoyl-L-alanine amidase [Clostridium sp. SHJSY1]